MMKSSMWSSSSPAKLAVLLVLTLIYLLRIDQTIQPLKATSSSAMMEYDSAVSVDVRNNQTQTQTQTSDTSAIHSSPSYNQTMSHNSNNSNDNNSNSSKPLRSNRDDTFKRSNGTLPNASALSSSSSASPSPSHDKDGSWKLNTNTTATATHLPAVNTTTGSSSAASSLVHNVSVNGRGHAHHNDSSSSLLPSFYTPAQQCRLEIEQWLNPMIDELLAMGEATPPMLDWVWDMGRMGGDGENHHYFLINMKFTDFFPWNKDAYLKATWHWQDQYGHNFTIDHILGNYGKRQVPLLVIKVPSPPPSSSSSSSSSLSGNGTNANATANEPSEPVFLWATNVNFPEEKQSLYRPFVYDLRPFLRCDRIETRYDRPRPGTKIGMCVKFRGAHHLIPPFIAYHRLIGVEHFWFFANEEFNITDLPQANDVTYVPYRYVWSEHLPYSRMPDPKGGEGDVKTWRLPFGGSNYWQVQAMQQCLYRVKRYGLDWLMTNDVDEYLWLNKTESLSSLSKPYAAVNISLLHDFLLPFKNIDDLGGLAVEGWAFGTNQSSISSSQTLEFPFDYVHRSQEISGGRRKIIYHVPIAVRIDVHWLRGGGTLIALPPSDIRWNHYRRPNEGIFQAGKRAVIVQDSSLPDAYRTAILESLQNDTYPYRQH